MRALAATAKAMALSGDARSGEFRAQTESRSERVPRADPIDDVPNFVRLVLAAGIVRSKVSLSAFGIEEHRAPVVVIGRDALAERDGDAADVRKTSDDLLGHVGISRRVDPPGSDVGPPGVNVEHVGRVFLVGDHQIDVRQ